MVFGTCLIVVDSLPEVGDIGNFVLYQNHSQLLKNISSGIFKTKRLIIFKDAEGYFPNNGSSNIARCISCHKAG